MKPYVGNKLKLKDTYCFDGSVIKDNSGSTHDIKQLDHVKLGINGGITALEDVPTTATETLTTTIFDLNETLSIEPKAFFSNHYGETIASVVPNATNYFDQVTLSSDTFFEYTNEELVAWKDETVEWLDQAKTDDELVQFYKDNKGKFDGLKKYHNGMHEDLLNNLKKRKETLLGEQKQKESDDKKGDKDNG